MGEENRIANYTCVPSNSGENSNETVHHGWNLFGKKVLLSKLLPLFRKKVTSSKVLPFPRFNRKDQIFCTICVDYQCKASSQGKKNYHCFVRGTMYDSLQSSVSFGRGGF